MREQIAPQQIAIGSVYVRTRVVSSLGQAGEIVVDSVVASDDERDKEARTT